VGKERKREKKILHRAAAPPRPEEKRRPRDLEPRKKGKKRKVRKDRLSVTGLLSARRGVSLWEKEGGKREKSYSGRRRTLPAFGDKGRQCSSHPEEGRGEVF